MYITEYIKIDEKAKIAIRGVMMYREKRDLVEKQDKVLDIFVVYRAFPKRSQRRGMWRKLWKGEARFVHVESFVNPLKLSTMNFGIIGRSVFGFEVRALRKRLKPEEKILFDRFYYQK